MTRKYRSDSFNLEQYEMTANGYLNISGIVTRTGVFKYNDGNEFRPAEEIFRQDSLNTMFAAPVTWEHPPDLLNNETTPMYQKGFVASKPIVIRNDDNSEIGVVKLSNIIIQDRALIDEIVNKKISQFSLGYSCDIKEQSGRFDDEDYDRIQKNVVYNHLALVKDARCGDVCSIISKENVEMKKATKKDCSCKSIPETRKDEMGDKLEEKKEEIEEKKEDADEDTSEPAWVSKLSAQHDKILEAISKILTMKNDSEKDVSEEVKKDADKESDKSEEKDEDKKKEVKKDSVSETLNSFKFTEKRNDGISTSFKPYSREEFLNSIINKRG